MGLYNDGDIKALFEDQNPNDIPGLGCGVSGGEKSQRDVDYEVVDCNGQSYVIYERGVSETGGIRDVSVAGG
ncbi:MAG: hypothetical protein EZS28_041761 [Streblomastix strix]|uniref:Uncharacterized protein n=1 Tax=Streblomastix strix TaxID=222440 RepID=A0A5J4TY13_9EUKA|nr:MAG: hypothetical protein EZS28_041761 [Streblomastix strix]